MGIFGICGENCFCMLDARTGSKQITVAEIFVLLKNFGMTSDNVDAYAEAFKKWCNLSVELMPLNIVYLAQPNHLVSLPFYDPQIAKFVVGIDVEGTCYFAHGQGRQNAPFVYQSDIADFIAKKSQNILMLDNIENAPRLLSLPVTQDLINWFEYDEPKIAHIQSALTKKVLPSVRCQTGIYWISPDKSAPTKVCARLDYDHVVEQEVKNPSIMHRIIAVAHLDNKYDFIGQFTELGELTPETMQELEVLRSLALS